MDINNVGVIQEKEGDELFIDLIKARKHLFNIESADYKDGNVSDNVMEEISLVMNDSGEYTEF